MKTAAYLFALFVLAAFAGMGYGFSIDRFAGFLGAFPGLFGMIGILVWITSPDGLEAAAAYEYSKGVKRREAFKKGYAARGNVNQENAGIHTRTRSAYASHEMMRAHYVK